MSQKVKRNSHETQGKIGKIKVTSQTQGQLMKGNKRPEEKEQKKIKVHLIKYTIKAANTHQHTHTHTHTHTYIYIQRLPDWFGKRSE